MPGCNLVFWGQDKIVFVSGGFLCFAVLELNFLTVVKFPPAGSIPGVNRGSAF